MKFALLLGDATLATSTALLPVPEPTLSLNSALHNTSLNITEGINNSTQGDGFVKAAARADWASNAVPGRKLMAAMKGH
jgi:hypothetical protein